MKWDPRYYWFRGGTVVSLDGELAGIVSLSDVVVLGMELRHVANTIRAVSPAYERPATGRYV